jgi:hypothetical protein
MAAPQWQAIQTVRSIDAGLQLAAVALLGDEGVESSARRFKVFLSHATAVLPPRPLMMRFRPSS